MDGLRNRFPVKDGGQPSTKDVGRAKDGKKPKTEQSFVDKIQDLSYILPVVGTVFLMWICYFIGNSGFSVLWIIIFAALNVLKSKLWKDKQDRILVHQEVAKKEREYVVEALKANFKDMPSWVQFPDTERVEWVNKIILKLWPSIAKFANVFVSEVVEPKVKEQIPGPFKAFRFETVDVGDIPCRVTGIKVYAENVTRDKIIMDLDIAYAGDANFEVVVGGFKAGVDSIQFKGKLRVVLGPLVPQIPLVGAVTAYFMDQPAVDFNLTGIGNMVELPGLYGAMMSVVEQQMAAMVVMPNNIVVPLIKDLDLSDIYLPKPDGVLRIHLVRAKNLTNRDSSLLGGKSDPYCKITVGGQLFRSRTVNNSLQPEYNEWFEAIVGSASGQHLLLEIYDEDNTSKDEYMGAIVADLETVKKQGKTDEWYSVVGAKHGDVHVILHWISLSSDPKDIAKSQWDEDWEKANEHLSSGVFMLFVDSIEGLPYQRGSLEPSPYITVSYGDKKHKSGRQKNTCNPVFEVKYRFLLLDPKKDSIKVEVLQFGNDRSLGSVWIQTRSLVDEPNMTIQKRVFLFPSGTQEAKMTLSMKMLLYKPAATVQSTSL